MLMVQGSPTSSAASAHAQTLENGMFGCEDCDFETNSLRKLGRHRSVNHSGTKYRCTECDFVTGYQSNFYRHRKQIHSNAASARMTVIPSRVNHPPLSSAGGPPPMTSSVVDPPSLGANLPSSPAYPPGLAHLQSDPFGLGLLRGAPGLPQDPATTAALMSSLAGAHGLQTANLLPPGLQHQLSAFMFAQAAAAAYLAAGGQSAALSGAGQQNVQPTLHNPAVSKSPEELVNDVLNDLSPMPSVIRTAPGPNSSSPSVARDAAAGSPAMPHGGAAPLKHCPVRTYACPHGSCGHETRETRDHLHHLRDCHGERLTIFYCDHCSYASKTVAKVRRHASLIHKVDHHPVISSAPPDLNPPGGAGATTDSAVSTPETGTDSSPLEQFRCGECKYTTTDPARFKKHQRCHQVYGPTTCSMCDFTTVYAWNLDRHVKSHNVAGRFACFRCSFSQNTRQSMSFHLQHHHIIPKTDVETQTEPPAEEEDANNENQDSEEQMPPGAMGHEVFLFERHAVHVNDTYDPNALSEHDPSSPAVATEHASHATSPHSGTESAVPVVRKTPNATITVMPAGSASRESKTPTKLMPEAEIIESPAEPSDLREYESADPDIRKRTCSICGYQGKWISEMVRHKRVHTNERPFKCKYCSRTSKWKADLIRHVAKAHGIKVVSRYSRGTGSEQFMRMNNNSAAATKPSSAPVDESLAIDVSDRSLDDRSQNASFAHENSTTSNNASDHLDLDEEQRKLLSMLSGVERSSQNNIEGPTLNEAQLLEYFRLNGASPHAVPTSTSSSDHASNSSPSPPTSEQDGHGSIMPSSSVYTCTACSFVSPLSSEVHKHIRLSTVAHERAEVRKPVVVNSGALKRKQEWVCARCRFANGSRTEVIEHLSNVHSLPAYVCPKCSFSSLYRKACVLHASATHGIERVVENLIEPNSGEPDRSVPPKKRKIQFQNTENLDEMSCNLCPFNSQNLEDLNQHIQGHEIPKAPLAYKCAFCPWYSRRKQQIQAHMALHTENPEDFMATVERNLITPMSHPQAQNPGDVAVKQEEGEETNDPSEFDPDQPWDLSAKKPKVEPCNQQQVLANVASPLANLASPLANFPNPLANLRGSAILGLSDLSDVFKEFEALLPNAGLTSPQKVSSHQGPITIRHTGDYMDTSTAVSLSPWNASTDNANDSEPEDLVPRTAEIQKVKILVDGKESKVWQCRYCLHTSKRRANVRLHERKHFKRALKGTGFTRCPQCDFQGQRDEVLDHMIEDHSDNGHLFGRTGGGGGGARARKIPKSMVSSGGSTLACNPGAGKDAHAPVAPKPKNHTCASCPAKFTDKAQLSRHEKFHGTDLRYKCHMCNYSVPFPINLTKHYKSHHSVGIIVTGNGTRQSIEENPENPEEEIPDPEIEDPEELVENPELEDDIPCDDTFKTEPAPEEGLEDNPALSPISEPVEGGSPTPPQEHEGLPSTVRVSPISEPGGSGTPPNVVPAANGQVEDEFLEPESPDSEFEGEPSALIIDA